MAKSNQNFTMCAGETETVKVTVTKSDGTPLPLTGATIQWVLQQNVYDPSYIAHKSTPNDITVIDATNGVFQFQLAANDTKNLRPGTYYHEARVTDGVGDVFVALTGTVTINASAQSI